MSDFVPPVSNRPTRSPVPPQYRQRKGLPTWAVVAIVLGGMFIISKLMDESESSKKNPTSTSLHDDGVLPDSVFQPRHDQPKTTEADLKKWEANTVDRNTIAQANKEIVFIDVTRIARKSKADVEVYLGKPESHEITNPSNTPCPCDKYIYKNETVEVVYVKGKADWITINNMHSTPFKSNSILSALGLPNTTKADDDTEFEKRWYGINGYVEINASPNGAKGTDFVFVQAVTDL